MTFQRTASWSTSSAARTRSQRAAPHRPTRRAGCERKRICRSLHRHPPRPHLTETTRPSHADIRQPPMHSHSRRAGNAQLPGGGSFNLGSMSGMMPSIVKMAAQSSGLVPLAPSAVGTSLSPKADRNASAGVDTNVHYDNSINITGLQDPNQVQQAMQEERNPVNPRREIPLSSFAVTGPGGG
jgi:hypothetical protein